MFFFSFLAFSLPKFSETLGVYLALAALAGIAFLAFLTFMQGRELKELRKWAQQEEERSEALLQKVRLESRRRAAPPAVQTPGPTTTKQPQTPAIKPIQQGAQQPTQAIPAISQPIPTAVPSTTVAAAVAGQGAQPKQTKPGQPTPVTNPPQPQQNPETPPSVQQKRASTTPTTVRTVPKNVKQTASNSGKSKKTQPPAKQNKSFALRKIAAILIAVFIVAGVGVIAKQTLFSSGGDKSSTKTNRVQSPTDSPTTRTGNGSKPVDRATIDVTVLNATTVNGLAAQTAQQLKADGYKNVGTGTAAQTVAQPETTVNYAPGKRRAATTVARSLNIDVSNVQPIDAATQTIAPNADVVVTLGNDQTPNQPAQ